MTTLGLSVFCLTFGLVKANDWGWGSTRDRRPVRRLRR